jgi:hypothetical protein
MDARTRAEQDHQARERRRLTLVTACGTSSKVVLQEAVALLLLAALAYLSYMAL